MILINQFESHYNQGNVQGMREIYEIIKQFQGDKECLNIYVSKTTEKLQIKERIGSDATQFTGLLNQIITQIKELLGREIVQNYVKLCSIFGEADSISRLLLCEIFELKLKPYLHHALDTDNISSNRFLEYLALSYTLLHDLAKNFKNQLAELKLDIQSLIEHLLKNIFGPFLSNYFSLELSTLKAGIDGSIKYITEPLAVRYI